MQFRLRTLLIVLAVAPVLVHGEDGGDPAEPLYGKWEIEGMVYVGVVQDRPVGWMRFRPNSFQLSYNPDDRGGLPPDRCVVRHGEIDIVHDADKRVLLARFELVNDKLRIMWRDDYSRRSV
jgi:hypothetical protein